MIGQTIGHYRILDKLGEGGMGVVYLAEDTTLDRKVALKVLPQELAQSQERLDRFQREAKTLAALDHPNIVSIYSVEHAEGINFLTMQVVDGQRLSDLIFKGGIPSEQIFEIVIPLADALASAHEKGVIHRDLKPANIMVTDEGRVKVLDFGLAKLRPEADAAVATELPTEPLTEEGRIIGTMPYMSPEQLEGMAAADARSDIFSLGVILYEIATGERPFKGDTSVALISSIVKEKPRDVREQRDDLPNHLTRIVNRCLNKNPERRYQSAKDLCNDLMDLRQETTSGEAVASVPARARGQWGMYLAAAALLVAVAGVLWYLIASARESQPESVPSYREVRLTANPEGLRAQGVISPDGRMLAFRDPQGVHVQDIELGQVKTILEEGAYLSLKWHPDGRRLLVTETSTADRQDVWLISVLTGEKELLQEDAAWAEISPDGQWLAFQRYDDFRVARVRSLPDGSPRILVQLQSQEQTDLFMGPWSPNGKRLVFLQTDYSAVPPDGFLKTVDIEDGTATELLHEPRLILGMGSLPFHWLETGRLLFGLRSEDSDTGSSLWSMPVDEENGHQLGPAEMIRSWANERLFNVSASLDGTRIGLTKTEENWDVFVGELNSGTDFQGELHRITDHRGVDHFFAWLASDELLFLSDRHRRTQVLRQGLDGGSPEIEVSLPSEAAWPTALSPERDWILIWEPLNPDRDTLQGGRLRRLSMDGRLSGPVYELEASEEGPRFHGLDCPTTSNLPCLLGEATGQIVTLFEFDPMTGRGAPRATMHLTYSLYDEWHLSPDGTRVAVPVDEDAFMVLNLDDQSQSRIVLKAISGLQYLCWSQDQESIIVSALREGATERYVVGRAYLDGSYEELWTSHSTWFTAQAASPDDQHVALNGNQLRSDVWMLCTNCPGD